MINMTASKPVLSPYVYNAEVISVYDGDTCTVVIDLGFDIKQKKKIRMAGIDTPELRLTERAQGLIVRDYVRGLILHKEVIVETLKDKTGKYGRYLGYIHFKSVNEDGDEAYINLSTHLLELNFAEPYLK